MPRIAIQTPLYRSSQYLPMLLKSLKEQTFLDWTFYAVENSGDVNEQARVKGLLEQSGIAYEFFVSEANLGFADGHNFLMQKHTAEFILLLNEDAYLGAEHLARCVSRFEADANCAAVAGAVYRWGAPVNQAEILTEDTFVEY
jgi:GT2 family glycosyltransferase